MVGGMAGFCGAYILGERLGRDKYRQKMQEQANDDTQYNHIFANSREYKKVINHVNKDYHMAFKEWLVN